MTGDMSICIISYAIYTEQVAIQWKTYPIACRLCINHSQWCRRRSFLLCGVILFRSFHQQISDDRRHAQLYKWLCNIQRTGWHTIKKHMPHANGLFFIEARVAHVCFMNQEKEGHCSRTFCSSLTWYFFGGKAKECHRSFCIEQKTGDQVMLLFNLKAQRYCYSWSCLTNE